MNKLICIIFFLCSFNALASNQIKVAVIDTGLDFKYSSQAKLCPTGHKDFTGEGLDDINGHGSNVVGLITKNTQNSNYCIILLKAYAFKTRQKAYITEALQYAYSIGVNVINLSGGGLDQIQPERDIILKLLNKNITVVASSGNDGLNLDISCVYYPACYDKRIYVIGNTGLSSNYGQVVDTIYNGNNKTGFGRTLSGTSQSTAIFTGDLLKTITKLSK